MTRKAWLGLGGNLGDPVAAMGRALRALDSRDDTSVTSVSPVYYTPPWGKVDQPSFFNACAKVVTELGPEALLSACLDIELEMKRERLERWGPRIIDIDVLAYEGVESLESISLILPHPRMTERAFVLVPLADIAPELVIEGKQVAQWAQLADKAGMTTARDDAGWWRKN
ncbi:2-amino-4-hydroxy-6-hydroxymethyldihydropteridine diphosphokinase [Phyllobacterium sp. YR531]|uniref:2-amino-4-hydroxy-6- hydroxymethyldihydropteridine diphosphokinase n=1 Tax=Phyllobacterium sp. YR531 TaxID=1144343 RepID=UPI00026F5B21|nr:2-amino-4-hydroxy-6-hydroxymethyldihydropteridine diphosphokinase [Phyllobacterium sp. YR531]EJN03840.1 2-amino-4-hydroxy-6-hydroxymethyldihydropteridine pyrophosphokinase [Phyllobacterium sp. YR531]